MYNENESFSINLNLEESQKKILLDLAHSAVKAQVKGEQKPQIPDEDYLKMMSGVFVTVYHGSELRGCLGCINALKPLGESIVEMAKASASRDPRFSAIQKNELDDLNIEISILTPFTNIKPDKIIPGKHGLMIKQGINQGLLLPQVATRYNWDRREFLRQTCRKAGLSPEAWNSEDTEIQSFEALVFSDREF